MPETKNKSIEEISSLFLNEESGGFLHLTNKKMDSYKSMESTNTDNI